MSSGKKAKQAPPKKKARNAKAPAKKPRSPKPGAVTNPTAINPSSLIFSGPPASNSADAFVQMVTGSARILTPEANALQLSDYYNTVPIVRAVVGRVADGVSRQQWFLVDKANNSRLADHPALDWLAFGNKRLRGRSAIKLTITLLDLQGECFWIIGRDASGRPASYAPVPSHFVVSVPIGNEADGGQYVIRPRNGVQYAMPASDVLWFHEANPSDPYARGRGIAGAVSSEIATDESAADYLEYFFKNNARPDLIISGSKDAVLNAQGADRLKEQLNEEYRGSKRRGKPIITASPLTVQPLGANLKDNDVQTIRKGLVETLRTTYGVSPEILGFVDSSNRSTIDAAQVIFATYVIEPRLVKLQETLEPFLEDEFNIKAAFSLEYENPVSEDRALKIQVMAADKNSFSKNEFRVLAGFEAVDEPGYDAYPQDPQPAVQPNFPPHGAPSGAQDGQPNEAGNGKALMALRVPAPARKVGPKVIRNKHGRKVGEVRKALSPADVLRISDALDDPSVSVDVTALINDVYQRMVERYGEALLKEMSSEVRFELNTEIASWIDQNAPELLDQIDETTRQSLQDTIDEGVQAGEDFGSLSSRVDAVFAEAADIRASTIGDTVATQLTGFATLAASRQGGFQQKEWLTSGDTAVRPTHRALDNKIIGLSEKFTTPDGQADHPGDFGVAAEDINCRCAIRPVLDGEKAFAAKSFRDFHRRQHGKVSTAVKKSVVKAFSLQHQAVIAELKRAEQIT